MTKEPWEHFVEQLKLFLQIVHESFNKNVHILPWDPSDYKKCPPIKLDEDFPEANRKPRGIHQMYFGGNFACPRAKEVISFLKLRIGIIDLGTMENDLDELGALLYDHFEDEQYISLGRNPYACQTVRVKTLGSLYVLTRLMDFQILVRAITWQILKNERKQQYPWNLDYPPPQALHVEINANYAPQYYNAFSELFRLGSEFRC